MRIRLTERGIPLASPPERVERSGVKRAAIVPCFRQSLVAATSIQPPLDPVARLYPVAQALGDLSIDLSTFCGLSECCIISGRRTFVAAG